MRHSRRFVLISGEGAFVVPSFTGSYSLFGDAKKGYIEIYSSGTLTFSKKTIVDVFVMGSGLRGVDGSENSSGTISYQYGGKGGNGAKGATYTGIEAMGDYAITIAAACSSTSTANASSAFGNSARTTGASGGAGSDCSSNGKNGSSGISIPFGDSTNFPTNYGGGGGGGGGSKYDSSIAVGSSYMPGSGGSVGGGGGALVSAAGAGAANTGGGGGGGHGTRLKGANGGSGLVIVRWGDWSNAA